MRRDIKADEDRPAGKDIEGEEVEGITRTSVLFCKHGGLIVPLTSGQGVSTMELIDFKFFHSSQETLRRMFAKMIFHKFFLEYYLLDVMELVKFQGFTVKFDPGMFSFQNEGIMGWVIAIVSGLLQIFQRLFWGLHDHYRWYDSSGNKGRVNIPGKANIVSGKRLYL